MKNNYKGIIIFVVFFNVLWIALDFLYVTFITRGTYSFDPASMATPLVLSLVSALLLYRK